MLTTSTSGPPTKYRGVYFNAKQRPTATKPWSTAIYLRGGRRFLGCFATAQEAALAYDKALVRRDGPQAATNQTMFPQDFVNGNQAVAASKSRCKSAQTTAQPTSNKQQETRTNKRTIVEATAAMDDDLSGSTAVAVDNTHDSDDDVVFVMEVKRASPSIAQRLKRNRRQPSSAACTSAEAHLPQSSPARVQPDPNPVSRAMVAPVATPQSQPQRSCKEAPSMHANNKKSEAAPPAAGAGQAVQDGARGTHKRHSKYKGVYYYGYLSSRKPWGSMIQLPGSGRCYLGLFNTQVQAARVYDKALLQRDGDRAVTNQSKFPEDFDNNDSVDEAAEDEHVRLRIGDEMGMVKTARGRRVVRRAQYKLASQQPDSPDCGAEVGQAIDSHAASTHLRRDTHLSQRGKRAKLAPATPAARERKRKPSAKPSRRRFPSLLSSQRDSDEETDWQSEDLPECEARTSKYKGVHWHPQKAVWFARIRNRQSRDYQILGYSQHERVAAMAYDAAALQAHDRRIQTNVDRFPDDFPELQAAAQPKSSSLAQRHRATKSDKNGQSAGDKPTA